MSYRRLSTLLDQEYFLVKVFSYLLDDGLHECRRVCPRWFEVCSRMPVKLFNVSAENLPIVVEKFPNAVSLSVPYSTEWTDEAAEAIKSLAQLKNLEVIESDEVTDNLRAVDVLPFYTSLAQALQSCHQLRSFNIKPFYNVEAGMCLYSHLSHLTGLTRLQLNYGWEKMVNDPYTEIRNIEDLGIVSVCLENGQLVFPCLTHLTRLSMCWNVSAAEKFRRGALQMILPYASSLQSLGIYDSYSVLAPIPEWALLTEFRQLTSVKFVDLDIDDAQDFCAALCCLNLAQLGFDSCEFPADFAEKMAGVTSLVSLRSISFNSHPYKDFHEMFAAMPQLTSLRMVSLIVIESLAVLTALRVLEFDSGVQDLTNLFHTFSHLSSLESLTIKGFSRSPCKFSTSCISCLTNLRSLSLEGFSLDQHIFTTLAQISGLMELSLPYCRVHSKCTLSETNALTSLQRLNLYNFVCPENIFSVLVEGKFPRLRYLSFKFAVSDVPKLRPILLQKFPSLRQCGFIEPDYGFVFKTFVMF